MFYIDYGNQETVPYSAVRPIEPSVSSAPGLAQLCRLAYIKVPSLEDDFGPEAGEYLHTVTLGSGKEFKAVVEERDTSGGKVKGQGTGTELAVTLIAVDDEISVNAAMLQVRCLIFSSQSFKLFIGSLYEPESEMCVVMITGRNSEDGETQEVGA